MNAREAIVGWFDKLSAPLSRLRHALSDNQGRALWFAEGCAGLVDIFAGVRSRKAKILFVGNGASAAIASHQALDWWKTAGVRALAFNDPASLTACANDLGYPEVFAAPIRAFAEPGDILVAISSSGRSENILKAVRAARERACAVITLSGFDADNPLRSLGDVNLYVPSHRYGHVEVCHLAFCHALLDAFVEVHGGAEPAPEAPPPKVEETHQWADFLAARCRVIGWMHDEGKADADIAVALSMDDVTQVTLLRMTVRPASVHQEDPCLRCGQPHPFERCADERPTAASTPLIARLRVADVE